MPPFVLTAIFVYNPWNRFNFIKSRTKWTMVRLLCNVIWFIPWRKTPCLRADNGGLLFSASYATRQTWS